MNPSQTKILMLIGTRPEAIKMAPVYKALRADERFEVRLVSTGQHGELLHDALSAFGLKPDLDLGLMTPGQSLGRLVGRALMELDELLTEEAPDHVLVHGDTATGFAGALACFYRGVACAHVEAGLRSYRLDAPFPEEFHRQVVAKAASLHFAPTPEAAANLYREGVSSERVVVTGSTSVDAVVSMLSEKREPVEDEKLVVVTAHRRENGGEGFKGILRAVSELARSHPDHHFVFPLHPNPNVRRAVSKHLVPRSNLELTEALPYGDFLPLLARASLILTDSGGIQEEAAFLGRRVLLLRDTTERPEAVSCGSASLVGTDSELIIAEAERILLGHADALGDNPFGPPGASDLIAETLGQPIGLEVAA